MLRFAYLLVASLMLATPVAAQTSQAPTTTDRAHTGGAQTLEDIMARQRGENVDNSFRSEQTGNRENAKKTSEQLGTLGGASDPDLWRALRFGSADLNVSAGGDVAATVMQDGGMWWLKYREGPLSNFAAILLGGTIAALALFFLIRGRVAIDAPKTGKTVQRFKLIERAGHWMMGGSFILLGLTGLISLFGRKVMIPLMGHDSFAPLAMFSKWVHNNVSWAFMLGLIVVFIMWVSHNIPNKLDLVWLKQAGGIIGKNHPPAKKFNAGQKVIFWSVILFGASISVTGLALLFPFKIALFSGTFEMLNNLGLAALFGFGELPTQLSPQQEMQFAQLWHAIMAFVLMAITLAHIYIGSIGMEGAFDAMGSGDVDEAWAEQHHSLWLEEIKNTDKTSS